MTLCLDSLEVLYDLFEFQMARYLIPGQLNNLKRNLNSMRAGAAVAGQFRCMQCHPTRHLRRRTDFSIDQFSTRLKTCKFVVIGTGSKCENERLDQTHGNFDNSALRLDSQ